MAAAAPEASAFARDDMESDVSFDDGWADGGAPAGAAALAVGVPAAEAVAPAAAGDSLEPAAVPPAEAAIAAAAEEARGSALRAFDALAGRLPKAAMAEAVAKAWGSPLPRRLSLAELRRRWGEAHARPGGPSHSARCET